MALLKVLGWIILFFGIWLVFSVFLSLSFGSIVIGSLIAIGIIWFGIGLRRRKRKT